METIRRKGITSVAPNDQHTRGTQNYPEKVCIVKTPPRDEIVKCLNCALPVVAHFRHWLISLYGIRPIAFFTRTGWMVGHGGP